jgi:hypothetical protein
MGGARGSRRCFFGGTNSAPGARTGTKGQSMRGRPDGRCNARRPLPAHFQSPLNQEAVPSALQNGACRSRWRLAFPPVAESATRQLGMESQTKNEWLMPVAQRGVASAESNWGPWRIRLRDLRDAPKVVVDPKGQLRSRATAMFTATTEARMPGRSLW